MGQTISEKILAKNSGKSVVSPGDLLQAKIDLIICHEVTTPPALKMLREKGIEKVFDPESIVVTPDHFVPNKDIASAQLAKELRQWVREQGIENYFEIGRHGICHAIVPEQGFVQPGTIVVGADSHTCTHGAFGAFATGIGSTDLAFALATGELWFRVPATQQFFLQGSLQKGVFAKDVILKIIGEISVSGSRDRAMEFSGEIVDGFEMDERMTLCNMAIEAGAKVGLCQSDGKTLDFLQRAHERFGQKFPRHDLQMQSDGNANFEKTFAFDFSKLEPTVACPNLPENVESAAKLEKENLQIDQAFLGSCTNGRLSDLRLAAGILKGKKVAPGVRMIVIPATCEIYQEAMNEGLLAIFANAGCAISTPTCGPCLGGHMGILAEGERCISSTNRNFTGRMGHSASEVFLASPATVAASAIAGKIADPRSFM